MCSNGEFQYTKSDRCDSTRVFKCGKIPYVHSLLGCVMNTKHHSEHTTQRLYTFDTTGELQPREDACGASIICHIDVLRPEFPRARGRHASSKRNGGRQDWMTASLKDSMPAPLPAKPCGPPRAMGMTFAGKQRPLICTANITLDDV
jgi:hypothetical protein